MKQKTFPTEMIELWKLQKKLFWSWTVMVFLMALSYLSM